MAAVNDRHDCGQVDLSTAQQLSKVAVIAGPASKPGVVGSSTKSWSAACNNIRRRVCCSNLWREVQQGDSEHAEATQMLPNNGLLQGHGSLRIMT